MNRSVATADLVRAYRSGDTLAVLVERTGLSKTAIRNRLLRAGVELRSIGRKADLELAARIQDMRDAGMTWRAISGKLGKSASNAFTRMQANQVRFAAARAAPLDVWPFRDHRTVAEVDAQTGQRMAG